MKQALYKQIASALQAHNNCIKNHNSEWSIKHEKRIESLVKNEMPSGSGIDTGILFDMDKSTSNKLIFSFGYQSLLQRYRTRGNHYPAPCLISMPVNFRATHGRTPGR